MIPHFAKLVKMCYFNIHEIYIRGEIYKMTNKHINKKTKENLKKDEEFNKDLSIMNEVREIEQSYTDDLISELPNKLEEAKERITNEIIKYIDEKGITMNPLVITNYFFKPIIPLGSVMPDYNAEKLAIVYEYYCHILTEVNSRLGVFPASLTSFCQLAGITMAELRRLKNSPDLNMRIVVEKIYDQIGDTNITMSQLDMLNTRSTIFKLKSQNEIVEKPQTTVHINITEKPDMSKIEERLEKYKVFAGKKGNK